MINNQTHFYSPGEGRGRKILFASFPADGHFNPLTGLAVHLKELGYDVRWYTSRSYAGKLSRLGIPHCVANAGAVSGKVYKAAAASSSMEVIVS